MKEFLKEYDTVLFRLADGTIKKFVASANCDFVKLLEEEITIHDLYRMGDITEDEHTRVSQIARDKAYADNQKQHADDALTTAWRFYYRYGPEAGFSEPKTYPLAVIKAFEVTNRNVVHKGVTFTIKRPT